ncbi:MAG: hypothetical protein A3F42_03500 [Gammaproteobacteria bacterium RIFCSPHIGHO2_12_FULL_37_34]|nr:MAG: hypothetical protein A3F42_03500 [Gammaproteobacteria bacterium RIFCSPHIGHO2_12_FULL_37_34]
MQKQNVIDLTTYRKQQFNCAETGIKHENEQEPKPAISKDLELAIQHLIIQLRELGPLKDTS